jgi:hypothetical protein
MRLLYIFLFISFASNFSFGQNKTKKITYHNIVILSDLSSRIRNMPLKDFDEIQKILFYFRNECVKPGQKIGDKSCITFSAFSDDRFISIDNSKIQNLGAKQRFINSTGEYSGNGLDKKISELNAVIKNIYKSKNDPGLDLISILVDKIENRGIIKKDVTLSDGINTTSIKYINQVHIFTDGYLEYQANGNKQFYFSGSEIEKIRKFCNHNKCDVSTALKLNTSLGLPPVKNLKHKDISLHIHETHERDKDTKYQTYKNPIGLRDNEILQAVWRKWADESGFKSFYWSKY